MAGRAYVYQLIRCVFGTESTRWVDTSNPEYPFNGQAPATLVECCQPCRDLVLRYVERLSTQQAVTRAQTLEAGA